MQFIDLPAQQDRIRTEVDDALRAVLDHGRYIMGPEVAAFEQELAQFVGDGEVVGCASGTDALVMALLVRGIGPGDAVFVPSFTFAATAEAVALLGASPIFVDIDPVTFNMEAESLRAAIEGLDGGLRPAGVLPVDLFGLPADYDRLGAVAADHDLWVIADGAQGLGGASGGRRVGTLAPLTTTSFFPAKPLGCYGDGGAVVALDPADAEVLRSLRVHGAGSDKYDNVRLGINGRLDTIQAAILSVKLGIFPDELRRRNIVAQRYQEGLGDLVVVPSVPGGMESSWAQYTIRVPERALVADRLRAVDVPTAIYYPQPLHRQQAYRDYPTGAGGLAETDRAAADVLSLPMHPYLEPEEQQIVITAVRAAIAGEGPR